MPSNLKSDHQLQYVNSNWTLFLDRDGVINTKIDNDYVKSIREFEIENGVLEAFYNFSFMFKKVIIVTNQQGIGKLIMSHDQLNLIHDYLIHEVTNVKGKLDAIYYCPHLATDFCKCRKPSVGMAIAAQLDYPDIDFHKSIIVGDSVTDIEFGKNLGMMTVYIQKNNKNVQHGADIQVGNLMAFVKLLNKYRSYA
jgi:D-glycero-D-manno-heptose 1,7-bisphosphate phosphatase